MVAYQFITSGIASMLILTPLVMILYMVLRDKGTAVLCMECQQCRAVCPVIQEHETYAGPKDIMVAAKSGKYDMALKRNAELCAACAACMERCPRKLGADEEIMSMVSTEMEDIFGRDTIKYMEGIPNPKMQRTYEAVVRRFEGKKINLPWDWITKSTRLRKFFNPMEDKPMKAQLKTHIPEAEKSLLATKAALFGEPAEPPKEEKPAESEAGFTKPESEEKTEERPEPEEKAEQKAEVKETETKAEEKPAEEKVGESKLPESKQGSKPEESKPPEFKSEEESEETKAERKAEVNEAENPVDERAESQPAENEE